MPYIDNKLLKRHSSHNIRLILLLISLLAIIFFTIKSLNNLSAGTLFSYPETIANDSYGIKELSLADINKDTYLDIIAVNSNANSIDVYINPSSTNAIWTKKTVVTSTQGLLSVLTLDIDNDSDIDIIYTDTTSFAINLITNLDGSGDSWQSSSVTSTAGAIKSMCSCDLNKDGNIDIVAADDIRGRIFYMQNKLNVNNSWQSFSIYENPKSPSSLSCRDIDNDGDIDVISTSQSINTILWHENVTGNGDEWETHSVLTTTSFANNLYVSDLDNDSVYDLISTNRASSTIYFHKNIDGDGKTWESTNLYENYPGTTDLFLIDLDLDGDNDVLTSSNISKNVIWLENTLPIANTWTAEQIGATINYPSTIKAADIDNDGDNDIIIGSLADSKISIAENMLSQTSHDSMEDILMSSGKNYTSVILGQAFVSNNDLFGADNSVLISIYDPSRNTNPQTVETIPASDISIKNLITQTSATISLSETNVDSNMFIGEFLVDTDHSTNNIKANDLERIEVIYKKNDNISMTAFTNTNQEYVIVDGTKPTISNLYPNSNIKDVISVYKFEAFIEDSIIGLGPNLETVTSNIEFVIDEYSFKPNLTYLGYGKWAASLNIDLSEGIHTWKISSSDFLGNTSQSDLFTLEVDKTPPYFVLSGDNKARTGDTVINSTIQQSSNRKSIRLGFDDYIDVRSVNKDASDFRAFLDNVEIEIESAEWFDSPTTSNHIFLNLKNELPPDATPTIKLVGSITDDAGNTSSFNKTIASDGINPEIQFILSGTNNESRIITNNELSIEVTSDEEIPNPDIDDITIQKLNSSNSLITTTLSPSVFSTIEDNKRWKWDFKFEESTVNGLYNIDLLLNDMADNTVTINNPDLLNNSGSTLFEIDTKIQTATINLNSTVNPYSYINLDYSNESNEYTLNNFIHDSHHKISIIESSVDDIPISLQTHDNILHTISPPQKGWSIGQHNIKLTVKDDAGNTATQTTSFAVTSKPLFSINLQPGFNLISFPSIPSNPDINSVIPMNHPVNLVMTYEPVGNGNWLVSERNPETKLFEGEIAQINSSKAYLLRTNSFEPLQIVLQTTFLQDANLPLTIPLFTGWNFVPIINISGTSITEEGILASEYFKNINATSILGINQFNNLAPIDSNEIVVFGKGYLVFVDNDTVLVPPK